METKAATQDEIIEIDHAQLTAILSAKKGCSFTSMDVTTEPKLFGGKKNVGRVTKTVSVLWVGGASYQNAITNAVARNEEETEFKAKGMHGGNTRRINSFLSYNPNTDNYLLKVLCSITEEDMQGNVVEKEYARISDPVYTLDGKPSTKQELLDLGLIKERPVYVAKTETAIKIKPVFVAYGTRGITKFRANGKVYKIKPIRK